MKYIRTTGVKPRKRPDTTRNRGAFVKSHPSKCNTNHVSLTLAQPVGPAKRYYPCVPLRGYVITNNTISQLYGHNSFQHATFNAGINAGISNTTQKLHSLLVAESARCMGARSWVVLASRVPAAFCGLQYLHAVLVAAKLDRVAYNAYPTRSRSSPAWHACDTNTPYGTETNVTYKIHHLQH